MINAWQNLYLWLDPIALDLGFFQIRWYSLMYVCALVFGYLVGRYLVKRGEFSMSLAEYDLAFFWIEVGVIFGARLGYIIFYDPNTLWYLSHPYEIFNPFYRGEFVGISGLSYHGAVMGFGIAGAIFARKHKISFLKLMDLSALAGSAGYFFGRIGNFINNRLVGRETDMPWGVYSQNALRHPSALYEAILEGLVVWMILFWYRKKASFSGEIMSLYVILYATMRFIAEFFRRPDPQLGFVFGIFSMGQILSTAMFLAGVASYVWLKKLDIKTPEKKQKRKKA